MADITVEEERKRRLDLWTDLEARDLVARARPEDLRQRRIYGGAQGIWVDKDRTGQIAGNDGGITVGILHTGRHYPDDLSEDGVIYHYPRTKRGGARDTTEIEATKSAGLFELPVFVILPGPTHDTRSVRLGWVTDWDDNSSHFLILFGQQKLLAWKAKNERPCVFVRGSRGSASKFLKNMDQNVRCARSATRCCSTRLICAARRTREVMIGALEMFGGLDGERTIPMWP